MVDEAISVVQRGVAALTADKEGGGLHTAIGRPLLSIVCPVIRRGLLLGGQSWITGPNTGQTLKRRWRPGRPRTHSGYCVLEGQRAVRIKNSIIDALLGRAPLRGFSASAAVPADTALRRHTTTTIAWLSWLSSLSLEATSSAGRRGCARVDGTLTAPLQQSKAVRRFSALRSGK